MLHCVTRNPVWQATAIPQGHPQILDTSGQQVFPPATLARSFERSDLPMVDPTHHQEHFPRRYKQGNAIRPEFGNQEQSMGVNVNQAYYTVGPISQCCGFPPDHERPPAFTISEPPLVNQGPLHSMPVSAGGSLLYQWMSDDGQNFNDYQVLQPSSGISLEKSRWSELNPAT